MVGETEYFLTGRVQKTDLPKCQLVPGIQKQNDSEWFW